MVKNLPAIAGDVDSTPDRATKPMCYNKDPTQPSKLINFVKFVYKFAIKKQNFLLFILIGD